MKKQTERLVDYKNIILVGGKAGILAANFSFDYIRKNNTANSIKRFKKLPIQLQDYNVNKAIQLNELYVLNKYLQKIEQLLQKDSGSEVICEISISNTLYDIISKNTYKYWLLTNKTYNGMNVLREEIELWKEFQTRYINVFSHVKFYSTNLYKRATSVKFNKAKMDYSRQVLIKLEEISKQDEQHLLEELLG